LVRDSDREAVAASFGLVIPMGNDMADHFYRRLFHLKPEYAALFGSENNMRRQKRKFMKMLGAIVETVSWEPEDWRDEVDVDEDPCILIMALGKRHQQIYKIPDESYEQVGQALLWALSETLGDEVTSEDLQAWSRLYHAIAMTMRMGGDSKVEIDLGELI